LGKERRNLREASVDFFYTPPPPPGSAKVALDIFKEGLSPPHLNVRLYKESDLISLHPNRNDDLILLVLFYFIFCQR
jgi:hypothetical protein